MAVPFLPIVVKLLEAFRTKFMALQELYGRAGVSCMTGSKDVVPFTLVF